MASTDRYPFGEDIHTANERYHEEVVEEERRLRALRENDYGTDAYMAALEEQDRIDAEPRNYGRCTQGVWDCEKRLAVTCDRPADTPLRCTVCGVRACGVRHCVVMCSCGCGTMVCFDHVHGCEQCGDVYTRVCDEAGVKVAEKCGIYYCERCRERREAINSRCS